MNRHDVQTVKQILTKAPFSGSLFKVHVGCGDDANIHLYGFGTADALELMILQHAKQFGLSLERKITDLIQEDSTLVCLLKTPDAVGMGSSECAFCVPKQFGLD